MPPPSTVVDERVSSDDDDQCWARERCVCRTNIDPTLHSTAPHLAGSPATPPPGNGETRRGQLYNEQVRSDARPPTNLSLPQMPNNARTILEPRVSSMIPSHLQSPSPHSAITDLQNIIKHLFKLCSFEYCGNGRERMRVCVCVGRKGDEERW